MPSDPGGYQVGPDQSRPWSDRGQAGDAAGQSAFWRGDDEGYPAGGGRGGGWRDQEAEDDEFDDEDGFIPGFDDGRRHRGRRPRRRVGRLIAPVLAIVLLCVLIAGGVYAWQKLRSPDYSGPGTGEVIVQVLPGDTATSLAPRLVQDGVVASTNAFISAAKKSSDPTGLEPGTFRLHKHMNAALAYALLLNP
jgi:UPF0755 protein